MYSSDSSNIESSRQVYSGNNSVTNCSVGPTDKDNDDKIYDGGLFYLPIYTVFEDINS